MSAHGTLRLATAALALLALTSAGVPTSPLTRPPAQAELPRRSAVRGLAGSARADTSWDGVTITHPRASDGSFAQACEHARRIVNAALGSWADSARWSRGSAPFEYRDSLAFVRGAKGVTFASLEPRRPVRVPALAADFACHSDRCPGAEAIEQALAAQGWALNEGYRADGDDGGAFAMESREALLHVQASWEGGDDSDSTFVPEPGWSMHLVVVPRRGADPRIPLRLR